MSDGPRRRLHLPLPAIVIACGIAAVTATSTIVERPAPRPQPWASMETEFAQLTERTCPPAAAAAHAALSDGYASYGEAVALADELDRVGDAPACTAAVNRMQLLRTLRAAIGFVIIAG